MSSETVHVGDGAQCNILTSLMQLCGFVGLNSNNITYTVYLYFVHLTTLLILQFSGVERLNHY
jgi:hypothetical protein